MKIRNLYEADARKVVAIMPGGFHPFHPGHKSLYDWAVKTFGIQNVYVAATADVSTRPFPFDIKKKLAAMAGVPAERFIQVKSPFNMRSYVDILDDNTALVFVRSVKDKGEQPLPDQTKKNGEPGYLRTYTGKNLNTFDQMGYMAYGPTINFNFGGMQIKSASELRASWPEMSDEDKLKAAQQMYGKGAETAVQLLNTALGDPEAPVGENLEEEQMGDVYMRFKVKQPLDKTKSKPTLMAFAGFANTPGELTLDNSKMNFNVLNKKQDIVNAIKKVIGDKIFIGAEKVVIYNDGAVNPKKFPQYGEFLDWVQQFGREKVKIVDKPESDSDGEKGPGKKRVKAKWANKKNYTDDNIETTKYFTIDNARLMKFLQKSAPKIMQAYRPASKQFVMEPAQYKTFRNWMRSPDVVSKFGDTNVKVDKSKTFSQSVGKEFEDIGEILGFATRTPKRTSIKKKPEKFEPSIRDKVAARRKAADSGDKNAWKSKKTLEKAPPGREKQVKKLKGKFDDPGAPYAIAWAQHNKHGKPKKKTNEGYKLQLERDTDMMVLNIVDTATGKRTEVRGKPGYETGNYDPNDKLHMLLDKIGKSADISQLMNGEPVGINPKHPQGASAKAATDKAYNENFAESDVPLGKYLYHVAYASGLTGMLRDGHLGEPDEYFSMTSDQKYIVSGNPEVQIVIDTAKVSKMETFEKYVDDWESTPGAGDWAKGDKGDFESEYRVEETIPWDYVVAVKILKSKATKEIIQLAKQRGVKLVGKDNNVTENFADGKKKGKSRPGRVKKSGASCNGSVTALRKRAKNASGEKAKMYHWCANMKSGKKKK